MVFLSLPKRAGPSLHLNDNTGLPAPSKDVDLQSRRSHTRRRLHEGLASPPNMMDLLDAIRVKCNKCCAGSTQGAKSCMAEDCPLWPYRMGIIQSAVA